MVRKTGLKITSHHRGTSVRQGDYQEVWKSRHNDMSGSAGNVSYSFLIASNVFLGQGVSC